MGKLLKTLKLLAMMSVLSVATANAQDWPQKPVKIVLPFPAGAAADILARSVAKGLSERWGQPVVVDNKPGANTVIGTSAVLNAAPDGYTLLVTADQTLTVNPLLYDVKYDPKKDFKPVSLLAKVPQALAVNADSAVQSLPDLIAQARQKPDSVSFGSSGVGSSQHLGFVELAGITDVQLLHVPYQGQSPVVTALLGQEISGAFSGVANLLPHVNSGKLRVLAIGASHRTPLLPDVPTVNEALAIDGFDITPWVGLLAASGVPDDLVEKIGRDTEAVLQDPAIRQQLQQQGLEVVGSNSAEFAVVVAQSLEKWTRIVRSANITVNQ